VRSLKNLMRGALVVALVAGPLVVAAGPASASHGTSLADTYTVPAGVTTYTVPAPGILTNDTLNADKFVQTASFTGLQGSVTVWRDGRVDYSPPVGFVGSTSFTYTASDGTGESTPSTTVTFIVQGPPTANADSYTTDEDAVLTVAAPGVLTNDTDPQDDALTAVLVSGPTSGSLTLNGDGSFVYTPGANVTGSKTFSYRVTDGTSFSAATTVTITMTAVNDAPVAVADSRNTSEDTVLVGASVLGNDTDADGDTLSAVPVTGTSNGSLAFSSDGTFSYTPAANFNGADAFTYYAWDGTASSAVVTVTITVGAVDDPPVAAADVYLVSEDTPASPAVSVLANDSDVDSVGLTAVVVTAPANGVLVLNADGTFTYTPNPDVNGTDSFTYTANDATSASEPATVSLTIDPVNDAPVADDDAFTVDEDSQLSDSVLMNDTDVDGDPLTVSLTTGPTHGDLVLRTDGTFDFVPDADFTGTDSFTYVARDGDAGSNPATVTLTVAPFDDAPVAYDQDVATAEDTPANGSFGVTDVDSTVFTFAVEAGPDYGQVTFDAATGAFSYTPDADDNGTDWITYSVCDDDGVCDYATVTLTVTPVNDAPVAADGTLTTAEDVPVSGWLDFIDIDSEDFTFTVTTPPTRGTLTVFADSSFLYAPTTDLNGPDSFSVKVCDVEGLCDTLAYAVTVTPVNDAPVITPLGGTSRTGLVGSEVVVEVTGSDVDDAVATYSWTQTGGTVIPATQNGGQLRLTPTDAGVYAFTVTVCDQMGACSTQVISLTVTGGPIALIARAVPVIAAALPVTGTEVTGLLGTAATLLLTGAFLVTRSRRRSSADLNG
jgi:VCBS repeat-containing protein